MCETFYLTLPKQIAVEISLALRQKTSALPLRAGIASVKVLLDKERRNSCHVIQDMTLSGLHKIKCDKRESKRGIRLDTAPCFCEHRLPMVI